MWNTRIHHPAWCDILLLVILVFLGCITQHGCSCVYHWKQSGLGFKGKRRRNGCFPLFPSEEACWTELLIPECSSGHDVGQFCPWWASPPWWTVVSLVLGPQTWRQLLKCWLLLKLKFHLIYSTSPPLPNTHRNFFNWESMLSLISVLAVSPHYFFEVKLVFYLMSLN